MAIAIANLLEEASTTGGDPVTTAGSITTVAGRLYVGTIQCSINVATSALTLPGTITMSATGLGSTTRGSLFTISFFWGICSVGGTGTVTADFASATTGTVIIVDEVTGAHATSPIVASSFVAANGTAALLATVAMNAFADSTNNAGYFASGINSGDTVTPESPWTELGNGSYATPARRAMSQWLLGGGDLSPSSTFISNQWACAAFEIAAAAAASVTVKQLATLGVG